MTHSQAASSQQSIMKHSAGMKRSCKTFCGKGDQLEQASSAKDCVLGSSIWPPQWSAASAVVLQALAAFQPPNQAAAAAHLCTCRALQSPAEHSRMLNVLSAAFAQWCECSQNIIGKRKMPTELDTASSTCTHRRLLHFLLIFHASYMSSVYSVVPRTHCGHGQQASAQRTVAQITGQTPLEKIHNRNDILRTRLCRSLSFSACCTASSLASSTSCTTWLPSSSSPRRYRIKPVLKRLQRSVVRFRESRRSSWP